MELDEDLKQRLLRYERLIFQGAGLEPDEYFQSKDNHQSLHYLKFGDPTNPVILLVHGYGGSAVTFFRIIPELMKHFYIIAVDLLGFGASDRPDFEFDNCDTTISFFTTSLVLLLNYLHIDRLMIIGHSMGAFISSHLAALIKERVIALFLVGAAGFTSKNFTDGEFEVMFGKISQWYDIPTEIVRVLNYLTFTKKMPIFNFISQEMKADFVGAYFETATPYLTPEERLLFINYFKTVHSLGSSAHNAVWPLLKYGNYSERPIIRVLQENPEILTYVYYGEEEWLDIEHVRAELTKIKMEKRYRVLRNCGHQVFMHPPDEFLAQFYIDYKSLVKDLDDFS